MSKLEIHTPNKSRQKTKLWVVLPDIHFPDQDDEALEIAKKTIDVLKPNNTLFLGDVLDCDMFSGYAKKTIAQTDTKSFKELELDPCNKLMDFVQARTTEKTYYMEGNHENRIERWAVNNGRVGESIYEFISPKATIARGRKNFKMVPYVKASAGRIGYIPIVRPSTKMRTGGLVAVHGWSYAKHTASVHLDRSRSQSIVFGHVHRQQLYASRDPWTDQPLKSWCPGTLSKLQAFYAHGGCPSDWVHGLSLIYVGSHSWTSHLLTISRGCVVLPDGKEIRIV